MTGLRHWSAVAAVALAVVTAATWDAGDDDRGVAGPPLEGAQLFRAKGCASCHTGPDSSAFGEGFPPLTDASAWAGDRRPGMTAADYLAESMTTPSAFISPAFTGGIGPTAAMPRLALSTAEVDALVEYLLDR